MAREVDRSHERKAGEQSDEPMALAADSHIGPESTKWLEGQLRLVRVKLPGVEIEDSCAAPTIATGQHECQFHERKRQEAKVSAATNGNVEPADAKRGRG